MIIFDLDGTLALDHHRVHFLQGDTKYWDEYFNACVHDELNTPIAEIFFALASSSDTPLGIFTGRSAKVKPETKLWLRQNGIWPHIQEFRMREEDDRTQDDELKLRWAREIEALHDTKISLIFEDRQRVVDMWRANGYTCCQVAPGAF